MINASSSGISIIVPKFSRDRMYSLPEFQDRRDFHVLYREYVDLMKDMYGKELVSFNLAETTVLFEIITEISGDFIMFAKDEEMMIIFGDHIGDDLYSCFDDAQFRIDRWLNL